MNVLLMLSAILGLTSVMLAAYIDHAGLPEEVLQSAVTAVRYQQFYAFMITLLALVVPLYQSARALIWLKSAAWVFFVGIFLFSFSIYAATLLQIRPLVYGAPIGGMILMIGWINLLLAAIRFI